MANHVRCILFSNESGSKEGVVFTSDMEADVNSFIPSDCTLSGETELKENDLPDCFPLEYTLMKTH